MSEKWSVCRWLTGSLLAICLLTRSASGAEQRPIPDAASLDKATKEIREVYRAEYQQATRPEAKQALAEKLLQLALDTKDDPTTRYAALRICRDIAIGIGDVSLTRETVSLISGEYAAEPLAMQLEALEKIDANAPALQVAKLTDFATSLTRQFARADRYAEALKAVDIAIEAARKAKSTALSKRLTAYQDALTETEPLARELPALRAKLKASPADAATNLAIGRFLCFYREDWTQGISSLALGGSTPFAELSEAELRGDAKGEALEALANRWLKQADGETPLVKASIERHALKLFTQAKGSLTGLQGVRLQKQIETLAAGVAASFAPVKVDTLHLFQDQTACEFSPDGRFLLTADTAFVIHVWDLDTLADVRQFKGHTATINAFAFFADGQRFASLGNDNKVRLWELQAGEFRVIDAPDGGDRLLLSRDGKRLMRAKRAAYIVQELASGRQIARHDLAFGEDIRVQNFSEDGRFAILSGITNTVRIGDMKGKQFAFDGMTHTYGAALSPDGALALTCGGNEARLWRVTATNASQLRVFSGHTAHVYSVAFSPDGIRAYSTGADGSFRIWNLKSGQPVHVYPSSLGPAGDIHSSSDGRFAALRHGNVVRLVGLAE